MNALMGEILSLRQAQEECAKENVALRARLMTVMSQQPQVEEEFNTPDKGEVDSVRGKIVSLVNLMDILKNIKVLKNFRPQKSFQVIKNVLVLKPFKVVTNFLAFKPFQVLKYEVILEEGNNNV